MPVLVMFIDLDRLKYINDTFGHEYGDFAIVSIAKAMLKHCDADAIAARTGGDEFIVLEGAKDEESGRVLAQKIRTELSKTQRAMQLPFDLGASIGAVVAHPGEENVLESYVKRAEMLMYEEKRRKSKQGQLTDEKILRGRLQGYGRAYRLNLKDTGWGMKLVVLVITGFFCGALASEYFGTKLIFSLEE